MILKRPYKLLFKTKIAKKFSRYVLHEHSWITFPPNKKQKTFQKTIIKKARAKSRLGLDDFEAYQLYVTLKNLDKIKGSIAEIGVFEGGSAQILDEVRGDKKMFLFDTFSGLPSTQKIDSEVFHEGQFLSKFENVKNLFKNKKDIYIFKGIFPKENSQQVADEIFSFVHIDVDLYQGTLDSLKFFYSRMAKGGMIIIHDYTTASGVNKAVNEFFDDKPESILEPSFSQALIVKI